MATPTILAAFLELEAEIIEMTANLKAAAARGRAMRQRRSDRNPHSVSDGRTVYLPGGSGGGSFQPGGDNSTGGDGLVDGGD